MSKRLNDSIPGFY